MKSTLVAESATTDTQKPEERPSVGFQTWVVAIVAVMLVVVAVLVWLFNGSGTYAGQLTIWVFVAALAALVPLAWLIGRVAEVLCDFLSPLLNGLLEASLANIPELSIGLFLLLEAHAQGGATATIDLDIIRGLLVGSVINNVLLTLGVATFIGAIRHGRLRFPTAEAAGYASMLALAVVGLAIPTLAATFAEKRGDPAAYASAINWVSGFVGLILIITYVLYVLTTIFHVGDRGRNSVTPEHEHGTEAEAEKGHPAKETDEAQDAQRDLADRERRMHNRRAHAGTFVAALVLLAVSTGCTVLMGWFVVGATQTVIHNTNLTPLSTGLIIFPIVCNLGEASTAIFSAFRKDIRQAMSIAAGSSIQIPLFVTPLLVFISFLVAGGINGDVLTLIFKPLELIVVALVTFVYALVNLDGETTWLEGLQLLAFFAMIAITAFALPGA